VRTDDEVARVADPVLERHRLERIVSRTVEIAQTVGDRQFGQARRVEMKEEIWGISGSRTLQGDGRIGQSIKLGHPAAAQSIRVRLIGQQVEIVGERAGREERPWISPNLRGQVLPEVALDALHPAPVIVDAEERGRRPVDRQRRPDGLIPGPDRPARQKLVLNKNENGRQDQLPDIASSHHPRYPTI